MKTGFWSSHDWRIVVFLLLLIVFLGEWLRTGTASLRFATFKKSERPVLYWTCIAMNVVGVVGMLCAWLSS